MSFDGYNIGAMCETARSWHLHTLLPKGLDFFIPPWCASSLVGVRKQANYATLNTYEDAIARFSISRGEKAVPIQTIAIQIKVIQANQINFKLQSKR